MGPDVIFVVKQKRISDSAMKRRARGKPCVYYIEF